MARKGHCQSVTFYSAFFCRSRPVCLTCLAALHCIGAWGDPFRVKCLAVYAVTQNRHSMRACRKEAVSTRVCEHRETMSMVC